MIIKSLQLKNFKQYQNLELDFQEGLVGIIGKNGAGKSTIFEGILLCLFGSINTDKDFYKTSWAGDKEVVSLQLTFEVDQKVYRVQRAFRGKNLTHQAALYDQKEVQVASGASTVNEEVAKTIGMDKEAFTRSIFSGQKELGVLSSTRGEERKRMIRKMIGLDNLDKIQQLIRDDRNSIKKQIQGQEALLLETEQVQSIEQEIKQLNKTIKTQHLQLDKNRKDLQKKQDKYLQAKSTFEIQLKKDQNYRQLNNELNNYQSLLEELHDQLQQQKKRIEALKQKGKEQTQLAPRIKKHLKNKEQKNLMEEEKQKFNDAQKLEQTQVLYQDRLKEIEQNIQTYQKAIQSKTTIVAAQDQHSSQVQQFKLALEKETLSLQKINTNIGAIKGKIDERKQQISTIEALGKEAECPTCLQPLINSYDQTIEHLQKAIDEYERAALKDLVQQKDKLDEVISQKKKAIDQSIQALNKNQSQLATLLEQEKLLEQEHQNLEKGKVLLQNVKSQIQSLGNIRFEEKTYQQLNQIINDFEPTYLRYHSIQDDLKKLPEIEEQSIKLKERIQSGKDKVKEQEKAIKALKYVEEEYHKSKARQNQLEQERDQVQQLLKESELAARQSEHQLQGLEQQLSINEKNQLTIAKNQEEMDTLQELDGLFKSFKTYILDKIKPTITLYAGDLFQKITKGRYESIHIDPNFEFYIYENGQAYPITRFSGGEIDLANLCLRIGISKAIAELSGKSDALNFLGFDEIFGSQDEERRFEILAALDLLKEQYRQIYIITHVDKVKEHFPNILQIQKEENGSQVAWM